MTVGAVGLSVRELRSAQDPLWEGWKSIYYDSFPPDERMTEGYFLKLLAEKAADGRPEAHLLALVRDDAPDDVIGIAHYDVDADLQTGFLWYLATRQGARNQGYGALFYQEVVRQLHDAGANLLLFEVEIPELARLESAERAALAQRRIEWYQRMGARVLDGVQYFQSVDAPEEPVEMHIMAHPFVAMSAAEVLEKAADVFGDALTRTGPPVLRQP